MISHGRHPDRGFARQQRVENERALWEEQREMHARHNDQPVTTPVCPGCAFFAIGNTTRDENGNLWHADCLGRSIGGHLQS